MVSQNDRLFTKGKEKRVVEVTFNSHHMNGRLIRVLRFYTTVLILIGSCESPDSLPLLNFLIAKREDYLNHWLYVQVNGINTESAAPQYIQEVPLPSTDKAGCCCFSSLFEFEPVLCIMVYNLPAILFKFNYIGRSVQKVKNVQWEA